jgi:dolichol-phosphate mannosyltransferase
VRELPFAFGQRLAGESKASWRNGAEFVHQMLSLRMGRMARFAAVGALGTVLNLAVMASLVHSLSAHYVLGSIVAAEVSILSNFFLQERFVFRDLRGGARSQGGRLLKHLAFNNAEAALRLPFLVILVQLLHVPSVLAQAVLLALAFIARFLFASRVIYRPAVVTPIGAGIPDRLVAEEVR